MLGVAVTIVPVALVLHEYVSALPPAESEVVLPEQITLLLMEAVTVGLGITLTATVAVDLQPMLSVPVTV
jgi:hypothetical protein